MEKVEKLISKIDERIDKKLYNNFTYALSLSVVFNLVDFIYSLYNKNFKFDIMLWSTLWLLIITFTISTIDSLKLRMFSIFMLLFASTGQLLHFEYFGVNTIGFEFYMMLTEAGEAASTFVSTLILMIIPFFIIIAGIIGIIFIEKKLKGRLYNFKYGKYIILTMVIYQLLSTYIIANSKTNDPSYEKFFTKKVYPVTGQNSALNMLNSFSQFLVDVIPYKMSNKNKVNFPIAPPLKKVENKDLDYNVIFILGETLRYDHLSLLGYKKDTTPRLNRYKDNSNFYSDWIYSGGTMTKTTFSQFFNIAKYPGVVKQIAEQDHCLFKNAKKNGFTTHFISGQNIMQLDIVQTGICRNYIDNYVPRDHIKNHIKKVTPYDDVLIDMLKTIDLNKNNFIVLHQRGSHSPYKERYPKTSEYKFKSSYDNSILYTDFVLDEIIKYINTIDKKTYIIFTGDHGELLESSDGRRGHGWFEVPVIRVPFFITSNKEINDIEDDIKKIRSHYDISLLITKLIGYDVEIENNENKKVYIAGTDFNAFDGYVTVDIKNNIETVNFDKVAGNEKKPVIIKRK